VSTTTDAGGVTDQQCLLEGFPLLDGDAIDCHVVFARKRLSALQRILRSDHHEMVRLVRILSD